MKNTTTPVTTCNSINNNDIEISFSHIQIYVDHLQDLHVYKEFEKTINECQQKQQQQRDVVEEMDNNNTEEEPFFASQNRDLVKQMLAGFGFRVTGYRYPSTDISTHNRTRSVLITSNDPNGAQFIITAKDPNASSTNDNHNNDGDNKHLHRQSVVVEEEPKDRCINYNKHDGYYDHFDNIENINRFYDSHNNRQGIAVLAFHVNNVNLIYERYEQLHPKLLISSKKKIYEYPDDYNNDDDNTNNINNKVYILEVYAYYNKDGNAPDTGTIIRFMQTTATTTTAESNSYEKQEEKKEKDDGLMISNIRNCDNNNEKKSLPVLPGLIPIDAQFFYSKSNSHDTSNNSNHNCYYNTQPAYFDHWVSNVYNRNEFLNTLYDTLNFTSKVDFNAGVVAAGEAQIESTVTGNESLSSYSYPSSTAIGEESDAVVERKNKTKDKEGEGEEENIDEKAYTPPSSFLELQQPELLLKDQSQVYLPINNALSNVGHVSGFLNEIGQGIQHIASRVENLIDFVQKANNIRKHIGEGFTFLRIPRSYYGVLTVQQLVDGDNRNKNNDNSGVSYDCACFILKACEQSQIIITPATTTTTTTNNNNNNNGDTKVSTSTALKDNISGPVNLSLSKQDIDEKLYKTFLDIISSSSSSTSSQNQEEQRKHQQEEWYHCLLKEYQLKKEIILKTIIRSKYYNLYNLLGDQLKEETYIGIVQNQILVDIQGGDLLLQIFTSNILQRNAGEEAPFFEFIQRVCSSSSSSPSSLQSIIPNKKLKPGCGGFGIRNFLTLFLSIEVSKAMDDVLVAKRNGNLIQQEYSQKMVDCYTRQLNESNPILTEISNAMTEEGYYTELIKIAQQPQRKKEQERKEDEKLPDEEAFVTATTTITTSIANLMNKKEDAYKRKKIANEKLMECSSRYNNFMKSIRQQKEEEH